MRMPPDASTTSHNVAQQSATVQPSERAAQPSTTASTTASPGGQTSGQSARIPSEAWEARLAFVNRVAVLANQAGRGAFKVSVFPAGLLQIIGAAMIGLTLLNPVTPVPPLGTTEFVTVIIVGAVLALAGPLVVTGSVVQARKSALDSAERRPVDSLKDLTDTLGTSPTTGGE